MIHFSPAKINLGLHILERRRDGFHNLRSVMYPIGLCDIIEIHQRSGDDPPVRFSQSGTPFEADQEQNLCIKAWKLMAAEKALPPVEMHLHKQVPVGAGLGGGSSNASTVLKGLDILTATPTPGERMEELAAQLGSDCPFFLHETPMLMEGRGELLSPLNVSLSDYHLVVLFPGIHISTAEAYSRVTPATPAENLGTQIGLPVHDWKDRLVNDFEKSIFARHPLLKQLKQELYRNGALYASMSGSGSSMFGIFDSPPLLAGELRKFLIWQGPA